MFWLEANVNSLSQCYPSVSIILTIALVGITAFYAFQTWRTVKAMKKATEAQFFPYLDMSINFRGPTIIFLRFSNVGIGAAKNIVLKFWIKELKDTTRWWRFPLLRPNEDQEFQIPIDGSKYESDTGFFKENICTLIFEAEYEDVLGNHHLNKGEIDLHNFASQLGKTSMLYQKDKP